MNTVRDSIVQLPGNDVPYRIQCIPMIFSPNVTNDLKKCLGRNRPYIGGLNKGYKVWDTNRALDYSVSETPSFSPR